jgi:peroxiredoxin
MTIIGDLLHDARSMFKMRRTLMRQQKALDKLAPRAGDLAPDFTLHDIEGKESITLSDFRGVKPVALIFGSFT